MHSNCTACSTVLHSSNRNSLERTNLPSCGSDKAMNSILSIAFVAKLCFLLFVGTNAFLQTFITTTSSLKPDWTKQGRNGAHNYCNTNAISYTALNENMRNNQVIGKKSLSRKAADVPQRMIHLLERMISTRKFVGSLEFRYDDAQIEEKIRQYKINVSIPDKASGLLLLRIAIAVGRRDVCKTLLRHGASQLAMDERGNWMNDDIIRHWLIRILLFSASCITFRQSHSYFYHFSTNSSEVNSVMNLPH